MSLLVSTELAPAPDGVRHGRYELMSGLARCGCQRMSCDQVNLNNLQKPNLSGSKKSHPACLRGLGTGRVFGKGVPLTRWWCSGPPKLNTQEKAEFDDGEMFGA